MIKKGDSLQRKMHMAQAPLNSSVGTLYSGGLVAINASGEMILCPATVRGFLCFSDKNSVRNNVDDHGGVASYGIGQGALTITQENFVEGQTYAYGTRLMSNGSGLYTPITATDGTQEHLVSAMALGAPVNGELRIVQL